jgi:biopolymer transport protein ExbD
MPIHTPGQKFRHHRLLSKKGSGREVAAVLSLTAMVDMFTVLVIFLLQNYNSTGDVLYIPKEVTLPKAERVKELKPAVVVTISSEDIFLDQNKLIKTAELRQQEDLLIPRLKDSLVAALQKAKDEDAKSLKKKLQDAVDQTKTKVKAETNAWNKVTIQADKDVDFLTIRKVMYTVSDAGAGEVNFAVMKVNDKE